MTECSILAIVFISIAALAVMVASPHITAFSYLLQLHSVKEADRRRQDS